MNLKFQNNTIGIKDVDMSKRTVVGYFSAFGNKDSDGDIIVKGAFSKTIKENKDRIAHLLQHSITSPIGKIMELQEDEKGLRFTSRLSKSTLGNDTLIQYQEGILKEHSVGFSTVKGEPRDDYYEIQEVKLWEGSTVTWGANPNTPTVDIKSQAEQQTELNERVSKLQSFMRKGSVSDETFRLIEFELERIKTILTLDISEPQKHSQDVKPSFDFKQFTNILNSN